LSIAQLTGALVKHKVLFDAASGGRLH